MSLDDDEHVEEEKKADGGKIKIPAHLMQASQAPASKPAWMQKLASSKQRGGGFQQPRKQVSDEPSPDSASEEKGSLALPYSPTRRRTYKIKSVITVLPTTPAADIPTAAEHSVPETSSILKVSPPVPHSPPTQISPSPQAQPSDSFPSLSQLQQAKQQQPQAEDRKEVLESSGSSNQDVFEDKTDDEVETEEEPTTTDDESQGGWMEAYSSGTSSSEESAEHVAAGEESTPPNSPLVLSGEPTTATAIPPSLPSPTGAPSASNIALVSSPPSLQTPSSKSSTTTSASAPSQAPSSPIKMVPAHAITSPDKSLPVVANGSIPPKNEGVSMDHPNQLDTLSLPRPPSFTTDEEPSQLPSPSPDPTLTNPRKHLDQGVIEYDDDDDNEEEDDWMFPHRHEDDSSWVNPSHPTPPERKQHLTEELKKKSVDLFPENGLLSERLVNLRSINEEGKFHDLKYDAKVGIIVDPHLKGDGQTVSETSFSEASKMDSSAKIIQSSVPTKEMDIWAMPSQDETYRAAGKLDLHKDGKDYRFSYIAQPHTHSTASYADVVRERYFPKEDNDYWAAPAKETVPELPIHISREGAIKSGPSDENESWMPPEDDPNQQPVDKKKYYVPTLADEKYSDARTEVTEGSDWMGHGAKSARVDFTGAIKEENSDSFEWNPSRAPSPLPEEDKSAGSEVLSGQSDSSSVSDESEAEDNGIATNLKTVMPRPPSPPATLEGKRAIETETAPRGKPGLEHVYDYSPSGRLKFDLTPEMIVIEGNEERGNTRARTGNFQKDHKRCLRYLSICFFFFLVPAAVACIVLFVVDPFDQRNDPSPIGPTRIPTMAPVAFPTEPGNEEGQSKAPTPTGTFLPAQSPGQDPSSPISPIDEDLLVDFLSQISSDGGEALRDSTSPQFAAMQWLRSSVNNGIYKDSTFIQRYALATLYYATGGQQWSDSSAWLTNSTECEWYTSSDLSRICDQENNLLELNLRANGLAGSIPPELNLLSNSLVSLQLDGNKLTGQLPPELSTLWNLETMQLSQNQFRGTIPSSIGALSNLKTLLLFSNSLRSSIPTQLGQLTNLVELDLGANRLTGALPTQLGGLGALDSLSLYNNELTGTIPSQLSNMASLRVLYLDTNSFVPSLPGSLCIDLSLDEFWTDCEEIGGCECCTKCCQDGDPCA